MIFRRQRWRLFEDMGYAISPFPHFKGIRAIDPPWPTKVSPLDCRKKWVTYKRRLPNCKLIFLKWMVSLRHDWRRLEKSSSVRLIVSCNICSRDILANHPGAVFGSTPDKGKGILGTPSPWFPPKDTLAVSPTPELIYTGAIHEWVVLRHYQSHSSLTVHVLMDRLQGLVVEAGAIFWGWRSLGSCQSKALDWHHFFAHRGPSCTYLICICTRLEGEIWVQFIFGPHGRADFTQATGYCWPVAWYRVAFVSLLNQLHLPKNYALSNLQRDISQYLQLFKPKSLVEGFLAARQVENIMLHNQQSKKFL